MGKLTTLAILLFVGNLCHVSRSQEFEDFRMNHINSIWTKAQKQLDGKILSDLYADLLIQDKKEKELKQKKFDGTDKNGLFEASVRQALMDILLNYGLASHFPTEKYGVKKGLRGQKVDIRDERLKKMLKSARKEGFTDAEMQILKEEMSHYQTKMDEYKNLKDLYEDLEGKVDNSLENEQEGVWTELSQKKKDMKQVHKEYRDGLARLQDKLADKDNVAGKFEDPRVYHLWALAQKSGMNEEELETYRSIRKMLEMSYKHKIEKPILHDLLVEIDTVKQEPCNIFLHQGQIQKELTHFETRIQKAQFLQEKLQKSETKLRNGEIVDKSEHQDLKSHHEKILKKVDKYHADLKDQVHRRIDEL